MSYLINPARFRRMGPAPTIRGSALVATGSVSTYNLAFPAGAAAGDLLVGFMAHGWDTNTVGAGQGTWTVDETKNGANINGAIWHKILDAADITRGFVTLTWISAYFGQVGCVCFVGAPTGIRTFATVRNGSGGSSDSVTTGASPATGDYAILFSLVRATSITVTVASGDGTAQGSVSSSNASGVSRMGTLLGPGAVSETYNFSGLSNSDYSGIIIVQP